MKEINIKINEEDIVDNDFIKIDENKAELILNIPMNDIKRKKIEKLDKAHRDMIKKGDIERWKK